MTVHARIILFMIAGYLAGAGWISEEVKDLLTSDPEVAAAVQAGIAAGIATIGYGWRWLAKKMGWST
jgi:1,4-dihydroxy-2-naphthoyl-CoA synthase